METISEKGITRPSVAERPKSSAVYSWGVSLLGLWMVSGVYLDAWAHHEFELETFFTPWHAVLYSGFLGVAALLAILFIRNLLNGFAWQRALPAGYGLSLVGAALFMTGGIADMVWHTLLGIENGIEALLSPPHLLLALGAALIVSGPLRAALQHKENERLSLPALLSLTTLLSIFAFFTGYAHPLIEIMEARAGYGNGSALTVAGILLQSAILMGVILFAVRRWRLPLGGLTLIFILSSALALGIHEDFSMLPYIAVAGLASDLLLAQAKPSTDRPGSFRLFAFATPVIFYTFYFLSWMASGPFPWRPPMWTGSILLAGVVGWLLSYAYLPPDSGSD